MNTQETPGTEVVVTGPSRRRTVLINTLAVAGFIALIAAALWLIVYSNRFVPTLVDRIGSAAVYLGSVFTPSPDAGLAVVPDGTSSTTIPFGTTPPPAVATSTPSAATTGSTTPTKPAVSTGGTRYITYPVQVTSGVRNYYGLPDLAVRIDSVGYLNTSETSSYVASSSVPRGKRAAVKFTVKNVGTNWSGTWRFSAQLPTSGRFTFESDPQQSLAPNDSIDYVLGFDRPTVGTDRTITVTANSDRRTNDTNTANDTVTAHITVLGS